MAPRAAKCPPHVIVEEQHILSELYKRPTQRIDEKQKADGIKNEGQAQHIEAWLTRRHTRARARTHNINTTAYDTIGISHFPG